MPRTSQTVSTRLDLDGLERLDAFVKVLGHRNPDVEVSRSDALRWLVTNSASALASDLPVALSHPPAPVADPRKGRAA